MSSLLTYNNSIHNIIQYYNFIASNNSIYCFIGKNDEWANSANIDIPTQTSLEYKKIFKSILLTKKIYVSDISGVIERIDWANNTQYSYYKDNVDMFLKDGNGNLINKFYIKNRFDQVFKCLWNNNSANSIVEPLLEPGIYDNNLIVYTSDGYKWKYLYTINQQQKYKFTDSNWIPVPINKYSIDSSINSKFGSIDVINVINSGNNYSNGSNTVDITIIGDGIGATASAIVSNNVISDISITNSGNNYTHANIIITPSVGYSGTNANAFASISPIGGHGANPIFELGCQNIILSCSINGTENILPTNTQFRQIGILANPYSSSSYPNFANNDIYDCTTKILINNIGNDFNINETVYIGSSLANATFSSVVVGFDKSNNILSLSNTYGSITTNVPIYGNSSGSQRVVLQVFEPDFIVGSGYIMHYSNNNKNYITSQGNEQLRLRISL